VTLPTPITLMRVITIQGGADQRTRDDLFGCEPPYGALGDRGDTLAFTTTPLDAPLEVTGPVSVTLHVSSDAPDTDVFAMLLDLYPPSDEWPDGYALNICDGIMRLRYREGMEQPQPLEPGHVYEVTFRLYPTSNLFAAGHRLQLLLGASSFPRFDVNPNTGEPIGRETHRRIAHNTIHHSATYPSRLTLPVIDG
jgi:putative CocE/NonD family hydrolase